MMGRYRAAALSGSTVVEDLGSDGQGNNFGCAHDLLTWGLSSRYRVPEIWQQWGTMGR